MTAASTFDPSSSPVVKKSGAGADRLFELITAGAAWFVLILLVAIAISMAWGGRLETKELLSRSSRPAR